MRFPPRGILLLSALVFTGACKDDDPVDSSEPDDSAAPEVTLDSLSLSSQSEALYKGQTASLTATATFSDGSSADVTGEVTWSSSDTAVATVTGGEVLATGAGSADITAEVEGVSAVATVSVDVLSISGDVALHGWPVADIRVTLSDGDQEWETWSDPVDGSFSFGDLGVGSYVVDAWGPNGRDFWENSLPVELDGATDPGPLSFSFRQFGYPSEDDAYSGDDSWDSASSIEVDSALQARSIWPFGTKDWIAVDLVAGVEYEFFTTALCETCDSYMYFYDTDGVTELTRGDDHIDYDSEVTYTPEVDGTYYIMVRPYSETTGVVNYFLGAVTYVDADADGLGPFHDCDDSNEDVGPWTNEVPGNNVDEDCDGFMAPAGTDEDADEDTNDSIDGAIALPLMVNSVEEQQYMGRYRERFSRTLHDADDVDWFSVTVPPYSYVYLSSDYYAADYYYLNYTVYEPDGVTEYYSGDSYMYTDLYNTSASEETWYVRISAQEGYEGLWYDFFASDYGVDMDQDGAYTQDWSSSRDCDDTDAASIYECYENN